MMFKILFIQTTNTLSDERACCWRDSCTTCSLVALTLEFKIGCAPENRGASLPIVAQRRRIILNADDFRRCLHSGRPPVCMALSVMIKETWYKLIDMPWKIMSIGTRDWVYRQDLV
jgi:hypothetical protein